MMKMTLEIAYHAPNQLSASREGVVSDRMTTAFSKTVTETMKKEGMLMVKLKCTSKKTSWL